MSWPVASFALVAAVLLAGWLAYERSRPSARTVALVATLSAIAALGRDAFAALDEVKPITAMTFAVGYALGPLPGFIVGAIGMLISNFLLGQGPYTPWQMAAWGIVGLLGAAAARMSRGRLGRLTLAIGCAFAAFVANEIMNVYTWTFEPAHTLAAFLTISWVTALAFDVVHIVSTLLFGLAFGPELVRLLRRARARATVQWQSSATAGALVAALLAGAAIGHVASAAASPREGAGARTAQLRLRDPRAAAASARADHAVRRTIEGAVGYLLGAQKADGGFGASSSAQSTGIYTAWAAIGLAAAGRAPCELRRAGASLQDALRALSGHLEGAGDIERTMLALHACGLPARAIGSDQLLPRLLHARAKDGSFEGDVDITAFAILALRAAGVAPKSPAIIAAAHWIEAQQNSDGGFSFATRGTPSEVDDTGAALEALAAAGLRDNSPLEEAAVAYLRGAQQASGGFPQAPGAEANAQSTSWAIQGLAAVGRLGALRHSALAYLVHLSTADGSIRYSQAVSQTPVWVTSEALAALALAPLPVAAPHGETPGSPASSGAFSRSRAAHTSAGVGSGAGASTGAAGAAESGAHAARPRPAGVGAPASSRAQSAEPAASPQRSKRTATAGAAASRSAVSSGVAMKAAQAADAIASRCLEAMEKLLR